MIKSRNHRRSRYGRWVIRLLINHPEAEIVFINSSSNAGNKITDAWRIVRRNGPCLHRRVTFGQNWRVILYRLHGDTKVHGESQPSRELKYRPLWTTASARNMTLFTVCRNSTVALPASKAWLANPGCFATCIQLGLLPYKHLLMLNNDIMVNAITGSTGGWCKTGINQSLQLAQQQHECLQAFSTSIPKSSTPKSGNCRTVLMRILTYPYRGDFRTWYFCYHRSKTKVALDEIVRMYWRILRQRLFVHIVEKNIDLKQVLNTNKCLLHLEKHGDKLLIISCIDNLLKVPVVRRCTTWIWCSI